MNDVQASIAEHEPLYHRREWVNSEADFDREVHLDFWEVGASGRVYGRDFVKQVVLERLGSGEPDMSEAQGWTTSEHAVRQLGADTYLFTYLLDAGTQRRVTRRCTIWRRTDGAWQALYHQGTVVSEGQADGIPPSPPLASSPS